MRDYQDVYQNGRVVRKGQRPCAPRWDLIQPVFQRYNRAFTLFDIGANSGYFGVRAAEEYGAVSLMVDPLDLLPYRTDLSACCMRKRLTSHDFKEVANTEHFDVTLLLSVLHYFSPDEWKDVLHATLNVGDHVIVEYPLPSEDCCNRDLAREQYAFLESLPSETLGMSPGYGGEPNSRKMVLFTTNKSWMSGVGFRYGLFAKDGVYVVSNYDKKEVFKRTESPRPWKHGINLNTFLHLGGVWPTRLALIKMMLDAVRLDQRHGDVTLWNCITDGQGISLIDRNDPRNPLTDDAESLMTLIRQLANP